LGKHTQVRRNGQRRRQRASLLKQRIAGRFDARQLRPDQLQKLLALGGWSNAIAVALQKPAAIVPLQAVHLLPDVWTRDEQLARSRGVAPRAADDAEASQLGERQLLVAAALAVGHLQALLDKA